jgi:hypothetical protein
MSISFDIQPRNEALSRLCVSRGEFEAALGVYLENLDESNEEMLAFPEDWQIVIGERPFKLSELATVIVETDEDFKRDED